MKFKDKLRFFTAKTLLKETVLFSRKDDWERKIREKIRNFEPFFYDFNEINVDHFDLVIPLSIRAQKYLNANHKSLLGRKALIPSNNSIDLCNDKKRFSEFLIENGFSELIPRINDNSGYPYILKKKIGAWGEGVSLIHDAESERLHVRQFESGEYFRQEYIEGQDEYTTHIIIYDKKIVFRRTLQFTFAENYFVKGKSFKETKRKVVDHSHFNDLLEKILNKLEYQGICCFNYKILDGTLKIFEVNPRYGGSMTRFINEAVIAYKKTLNSYGR
jgi:carbamoylphosphate synthase large subunit